jgi:hypothetical protein
MRMFLISASLALLAACSTTTLTPREYLDGQTAATITVAAQPLIFVAQNAAPVPVTRETDRNRDYVELYGIDVNRMGSHRQYIALLQWMAPEESSTAAPRLELSLGGETLELEATTQDPKELGVAQPLAQAYSGASRWWYYPADPATLKRIAAAREITVALARPERRTAYEMFSDGRAQLAELTAVLP